MLLSNYHFELPTGLIAQDPVTPRDSSKMLVVGNDGSLADKHARDLVDYLEPNSLLVLNNSKVIPAKFKTPFYEFNLHQNLGKGLWKAFAKKARKIQISDRIDIADDCYLFVTDKNGGEITVQFYYEHGSDLDAIHRYGEMPLPLYIKNSENASERYQTIYAQHDGSSAAPTAGFHFTEELFAKLKAKNIEHCFVTLHVGAGTFLPIKTENLEDHLMHYETGFISDEAKTLINNSKKAGKKIIAVGTTSLRLLESACNDLGMIEHQRITTNLFIKPGYKFKIIDKLLTNFHLPCTTLFVLVACFAGKDLIKNAYQHAIAQNYRFYSYGDCTLLTRNNEQV